MVDVGEKEVVRRTAVAGGVVRMSPETIGLLRKAALPKGDALNTARIAGVMAAKKTPELIPLCHGLNLTSVDVEFEVGKDQRVDLRDDPRERPYGRRDGGPHRRSAWPR